MDNDQNKEQEQSVLSPAQVAENIYTECLLISMRSEDAQEQQNKFEEAKENAIRYLDLHVGYWMQARAEFDEIIKLSKK